MAKSRESTLTRRQVLKSVGAASACLFPAAAAEPPIQVAGRDVEIQIAAVSRNAVRLSVLPVRDGTPISVPMDGSLIKSSWSTPALSLRTLARARDVRA